MTTPRALPPTHSLATLETNLAALDRVDPRLAQRLRLPTAESVAFDAAGTPQLLRHRARVPMALRPEEVERSLAGVRAPTALLLGVGAGELLDRLLARAATQRLIVWERDPWILRLALMRVDLSREILRARLRLALGCDLLDLPAGGDVVEHPLLAPLYRREIAHRGRPPSARRALLRDGGLFVEELGRALERAGFGVWTVDVEALAVEELDHTARRWRPELVVSVNHVDGLAEFARGHAARLVCWEIDPSTSAPRAVDGPTDHAFVFSYRAAALSAFRRAGFVHVEPLALAADPELRRPTALSPAERARCEAPVSFVGSSLVENAQACRARFLELHRRRLGMDGEALFDELVREQRLDARDFRVPALFRARDPAVLEALSVDGGEDPCILVGETAAAHKRRDWLAGLSGLGLALWGDEGWRALTQEGADYRGPAAHRGDVTRIYNASRVNVDVGRLYQQDIVTMRVFDVLACGGYLLAEHTPALTELFEPGVELDTYREPDELGARTAAALADPERARAVAERGRRAVLERHTIELRLAHMLRRAFAVSPG